jgi:hypothetical protein
MRHAAGCVVILACVLCGCATNLDKELAMRDQPVYRTGSNIAVKDHGVPAPVLSVRPDDLHTTKVPKWPATPGGATGSP